MKKELIKTIEQRMLGILNNERLAKLHEVLEFSFTMFAESCEETQHTNDELLKLFLSAKQVEGCSEKSLKYYKTTLSKMNEKINLVWGLNRIFWNLFLNLRQEDMGCEM